jgi:hypothetical protein
MTHCWYSCLHGKAKGDFTLYGEVFGDRVSPVRYHDGRRVATGMFTRAHSQSHIDHVMGTKAKPISIGSRHE